jgi:hypothetical protein
MRTAEGVFKVKPVLTKLKKVVIFYYKQKKIGDSILLFTNVPNLFYSIKMQKYLFFERV